jgi:hypothetical protein
MKATPSRVIRSSALARATRLPQRELYRFAMERNLPFYSATPCGFGISSSDLSEWTSAAAKARNEKDNRK